MSLMARSASEPELLCQDGFIHIRNEIVAEIEELYRLQVMALVYTYIKGLKHGHDFSGLIEMVNALPTLPTGVQIPDDPVVRFPKKKDLQKMVEKEDWYPQGTNIEDIFQSIGLPF
jgi:hypothetical protein